MGNKLAEVRMIFFLQKKKKTNNIIKIYIYIYFVNIIFILTTIALFERLSIVIRPIETQSDKIIFVFYRIPLEVADIRQRFYLYLYLFPEGPLGIDEF